MTRALLCALLVSSAAAAADPEAELEPGVNAGPVVFNGTAQQHYRLAAGKSLGLKISGPASLRFSVRVEGAAPLKALTAVAEVDGKVVSSSPVQAPAEASGKSDRGLPVTKAVEIAVAVPQGKHAVAFRWPGDAPADALIVISGVHLVAAGPPMMALPGLEQKPAAKPGAAPPPPLPLPAAEAKGGKRGSTAPPPPLPLPTAPDQKQASNMLPLPGMDQPPAAPKPVEQKPPEPPPAAKPPTAQAAPAAGTTAGTRSLTATRGESPAASTMPPPPAAQVDHGAVLRGPQLWKVTALLGGDRSSEDYTAATSGTRAGLVVTKTFSAPWQVAGEFSWRSSTQQYAIQQPGGGGGVSLVDENRFDIGLAGGYDFGPVLLDSGRLELTPLIGVKYVGIRNRAFPSDLFGPQIAGRAAYSLSSAIIVQAELGYTYNLSVSTSHSALGAPVGDFAMRAGLALPMSGGYALSLNYQGDVLAFNYVFRVAHGVAVGLAYSF